jgi:hypothetical protein
LQFVLAAQIQTQCIIRVLGLEQQEKSEDPIWISFQSSDLVARHQAFLIVNTALGNGLKQIMLPTELVVNNGGTTTGKQVVSRENGFDRDWPDQNNNHVQPFIQPQEPQQRFNPMVRSNTTDFSLKESSKPFSSVLSQFKMATIDHTNETKTATLAQDENNNDVTVVKTAPKAKNSSCCYSVDFMLSRAEAVHSKKMPDSWKELNEKYPHICFYGKVISYFNPHKYWTHWNKTKILNPILNQSPNLTSCNHAKPRLNSNETKSETHSHRHTNQHYSLSSSSNSGSNSTSGKSNFNYHGTNNKTLTNDSNSTPFLKKNFASTKPFNSQLTARHRSENESHLF